MTDTFWRRCSSCKGEIDFATGYWTCSVSTCNRKQNAFVFCSVRCFDVHLPTFRHREAWAEEQHSPNREQWRRAASPAASPPSVRPTSHGDSAVRPVRRIVEHGPSASSGPSDSVPGVGGGADLVGEDIPRDILIVASKLKAYVRARSGGLNTSDGVMDALSDEVRALCDAAIRRARESGRRTLLDRDF